MKLIKKKQIDNSLILIAHKYNLIRKIRTVLRNKMDYSNLKDK
jgi:hypothetical protein